MSRFSRGNPLIGKTIMGVQLALDKMAIRFVLDEGDVVAKADADCCSWTWIEHIELPAGGFPAVVSGFENLDLPEQSAGSEGSLTQFYGCRIDTDKGAMVIDYRNESNGYYGGNLVWSGEYFYGGVYGQNVSNEQWRDVTQDI